MSGWRETTTTELIREGKLEIGDGYRAKNSEFVAEGGLPFVRVGDIGRQIQVGSLDELPRERVHQYKPKVSQPFDSVITMKGTVGRVCYVPANQRPFVYSPQLSYWRSHDHELIHPRWLRYWLQSPEFLGQASASKGATDMADYINLRDQRRMRITLPTSVDQRRIAEVLAGLDDLIENNGRRVELLEQMTQAIYREWFVRFRYPGHEDAALVDSALGPIPEGWELTTCGDALKVLGGGTPSKKEGAYWEGGTIPWYTPSDLTKRRNRFAAEPEMRITDEGLRRSSARLFPAGSVLMTSRATLGVLAIATKDASCNQGFVVIPPDDRWPPSFIYEWLDVHAEALAALGTGATFNEITKGAFKRMPFVVPATEVLAAFGDAVTPIDEEVRVLEETSRILATTRDLLLPQLVTGQIDVSDLDLDALTESVA